MVARRSLYLYQWLLTSALVGSMAACGGGDSKRDVPPGTGVAGEVRGGCQRFHARPELFCAGAFELDAISTHQAPQAAKRDAEIVQAFFVLGVFHALERSRRFAQEAQAQATHRFLWRALQQMSRKFGHCVTVIVIRSTA